MEMGIRNLATKELMKVTGWSEEKVKEVFKAMIKEIEVEREVAADVDEMLD